MYFFLLQLVYYIIIQLQAVTHDKNVSLIHLAMAQAKNSTQLISTNGRWITK